MGVRAAEARGHQHGKVQLVKVSTVTNKNGDLLVINRNGKLLILVDTPVNKGKKSNVASASVMRSSTARR